MEQMDCGETQFTKGEMEEVFEAMDEFFAGISFPPNTPQPADGGDDAMEVTQPEVIEPQVDEGQDAAIGNDIAAESVYKLLESYEWYAEEGKGLSGDYLMVRVKEPNDANQPLPAQVPVSEDLSVNRAMDISEVQVGQFNPEPIAPLEDLRQKNPAAPQKVTLNEKGTQTPIKFGRPSASSVHKALRSDDDDDGIPVITLDDDDDQEDQLPKQASFSRAKPETVPIIFGVVKDETNKKIIVRLNFEAYKHYKFVIKKRETIITDNQTLALSEIWDSIDLAEFQVQKAKPYPNEISKAAQVLTGGQLSSKGAHCEDQLAKEAPQIGETAAIPPIVLEVEKDVANKTITLWFHNENYINYQFEIHRSKSSTGNQTLSQRRQKGHNNHRPNGSRVPGNRNTKIGILPSSRGIPVRNTSRQPRRYDYNEDILPTWFPINNQEYTGLCGQFGL